jgi:hypothetical protein
MNTTSKILCGLLILSTCIACEDDYKPEEQPSTNEIKYSVTPDAANPNIIHFSFTSDNMSPYWSITKPDGTIMNSSKRDFSIKYFMAGEYDATIQAYGAGGLSEAIAFKFTVPENDPMIYKLSGNQGDKIWVWDSKTDWHLANGGDGWSWGFDANDMANFEIYDDELNFSLTDYNYILNAHGYVYVDPSVVGIVGSAHPSKTNVVSYIQPENQTWAIYENDNGQLYLSFSNEGFPSFAAGPGALGADYEILELTDDILYLRWNDVAGEAWWDYRFKVKSDEPEPEPETELETLINYLTGGSTQKVWIWDSETEGHFMCGWLYSDPDWWVTAPNELADSEIYDDELSFIKEGNAYILDAHGYVYVDPSVEGIVGPVIPGKAAHVVSYVQPANQAWAISKNEDNGKWYLSFSNEGFPSFAAGPGALGADYEILELTDDILYLRWDDVPNETSWYYRFKVQ